MNVIDVGCSFIKSYLIAGNQVVNFFKLPTKQETLFADIRTCFENCGAESSHATIILSTSDCVVWEDKDRNPHWIEHATPPGWEEGLTPYQRSGHPRYEALRGAANQMLYLKRTVGLENIRRILPISAYVACMLADNPDWNQWDRTHASNSGFYDYGRDGWAEEAQPFIDTGVISEEIVSSKTRVPGNTFRQIYVGGHDSMFSNAMDIPSHTRAYVSCGTWTTVSVYHDDFIPETGKERYILAPNNALLKQLCFLSAFSTPKETAQRVINFYDGYLLESPILFFGNWSVELFDKITELGGIGHVLEWIAPTHAWGDTFLPRKASEYVKTDPHYVEHIHYFCEGA